MFRSLLTRAAVAALALFSLGGVLGLAPSPVTPALPTPCLSSPCPPTPCISTEWCGTPAPTPCPINCSK